ncbi:efflux RND transporter periplasmic adaptor subunit [Thiomicrorhabdus sp. Milos-T2]|uniref:efflux RND transporter periplasmic adaptor subunit n=1 Tax=Thiomicrorhabdus sp. Milos-T2 TaxID=90814 RepID=UPI00056F3D24|nr:biotin/lipoyl-binding protein [Thiomicrorhabdus sp. Milos-T2]
MFQKIKRRLIPILIIAVAIALFVYMKSTKPVQKPVDIKEKVWLVQTLTAKFEHLAPVQKLYGTVESYSLVSASSPVNGVVSKVFVKAGQTVKKGEKLVFIDEADLTIPLKQAEAEAANAKAQLTLQKLTNTANQKRLEHETKVLKLKQVAVMRSKQLMQKNLASQSALDAANEALVRQKYTVVGAKLAVQENRLKLIQAQASLEKAQASLQQAQLNLQRGQLVAPYDARIAKVNVSEGSRVNTGAVMVSFYALDSLELRAKLPVAQLPAVEQALRNDETLNAFYEFSGNKTKLSLLRLAGEATTSGVDAFFKLPESLLSARPGALLDINLEGVSEGKVLAVPYSAIYGNNHLFLVKDSRLVSHAVKVLGEVQRNNQLWALVKPDFKEGTKINITHLPNATSGLKIAEDGE